MKVRFCEVKNCGAKHYSKGTCKKHYTQVKRHGKLTPESERGAPRAQCRALKCLEFYSSKKTGLCRRHHQQVLVHGRLVPEREHVMGREGCRKRGCKERHRAKGYCTKHYNQARWKKIQKVLRANRLSARVV